MILWMNTEHCLKSPSSLFTELLTSSSSCGMQPTKWKEHMFPKADKVSKNLEVSLLHSLLKRIILIDIKHEMWKSIVDLVSWCFPLFSRHDLKLRHFRATQPFIEYQSQPSTLDYVRFFGSCVQTAGNFDMEHKGKKMPMGLVYYKLKFRWNSSIRSRTTSISMRPANRFFRKTSGFSDLASKPLRILTWCGK